MPLSGSDIRMINATRVLLQELGKKGSGSETMWESEDVLAAYNWGRFEEVCDTAETALVNVLIYAKTYFALEITNTDLHRPNPPD